MSFPPKTCFTWSLKGDGESLYFTPTTMNPRVKRIFTDIVNTKPFFLRFGYATNGYSFNGRAVSDLLCLFSPSAVVGRIVSIIVDSVKAVQWGRLLTHVFKEIFEPIFTKPPIANLNTSTTIPMIRPVTWVSASVFHSTIRVALSLMNRVTTTFPVYGVDSCWHRLTHTLYYSTMSVYKQINWENVS